jgi:hypothetical protein
MKPKRYFLLVLVLALLAIPTFVVFAKELSSLNISGPGISGELTLNDPDFMMKLEQSGFFDQAALTNTPQNLNLDAGYNITAVLNLDGKMTPFVEMVYYPTTEGKPGYVHYIGRLEGNSIKPADTWSTLSLNADNLLRKMMTANNVTVQSAIVVASANAAVPTEAPAKAPAPAAEPVTAPVVPTPSSQTSYIVLAVSTMIILLVGAGLALRRRTVSTTS